MIAQPSSPPKCAPKYILVAKSPERSGLFSFSQVRTVETDFRNFIRIHAVTCTQGLPVFWGDETKRGVTMDTSHPYQIFPEASTEDDESLEQSIAHLGVLNPIVKDDAGHILDGHRRKRISDKLGRPCPETVRHFTSESEKFRFVLGANSSRRHLSKEQKRQVIATYLRHDPEISNNWLGEIIGVSPTTVADERELLESSSQIEKLEKFAGKDGKKHPAKHKSAKTPRRKLLRRRRGQRPETQRATPQRTPRTMKIVCQRTPAKNIPISPPPTTMPRLARKGNY